MGRVDYNLIYTDISDTAGWRQTCFLADPWDQTPALMSLWGFEQGMVTCDLMHMWHLGVCRDVVGSAAKILLRGRDYFEARNLQKRMSTMRKELHQFQKTTGLGFTIKTLKRATFTWKNDQCPELRAKASDSTTMLKYLVQKSQLATPSYELLTGMLWCADRFMSILADADMFLSATERTDVYNTGWTFVTLYLQLAGQAQSRKELLFKCRPKWHFILHCLLEIRDKPSSRNPYFDTCFMDEDFVKKVLAIKRKVDVRTAALNCLKRFRVVTKQALCKHL